MTNLVLDDNMNVKMVFFQKEKNISNANTKKSLRLYMIFFCFRYIYRLYLLIWRKYHFWQSNWLPDVANYYLVEEVAVALSYVFVDLL